jgi:hypothetical protein
MRCVIIHPVVTYKWRSAMECPKCRHEIHLNLTPEELIYCPYCEQRMIPESAAALACEGGEPLPQDKQAEDLQESPHADSSSKEITPLPKEETSASENLSTLPAEEVPSPLCEEPAAAEQAAAPPVEPQAEEVPPQTIEEELTVIMEEFPARSVPEATIQQPCEELPVIDDQPPQEIPEDEDNIPTASNEEAPLAEATPVPEPRPPQDIPQVEDTASTVSHEETPLAEATLEPATIPDQENIPPCAGETPLPEYEQPQDTPVPPLEYTEPTEDKEPPPVCQEPTETGSNPPTGNNVASDDFSFCFACGQKLLPGALFCSRCGKKVNSTQPPAAPVEPPQPVHISPGKEVVKPIKEKSRVTAEPKQPPKAISDEEPASYAVKKPAPCSGQYVQPEDSPFRSREPVSIKLNSRTPARKIGAGGSSSGAMSAVRDFFSRQYVRFSIVAVALVALFVLIGLAMSYCG